MLAKLQLQEIGDNVKGKKERSKPSYPETESNPHLREKWGKEEGRKRKRGHLNLTEMNKLYEKAVKKGEKLERNSDISIGNEIKETPIN